VRLPVPSGGFADGEGRAAQLASIALRTGFGQAEGLVGIVVPDGHHMIWAHLIGAGCRWAFVNIGQQTRPLVVDSGITLDRRVFAAETATEYRNAISTGLDNVGILRGTMSRWPPQNCRLRGDAVVSASRILTEIDLDATNFGGISA
jgi:hypothetical protein